MKSPHTLMLISVFTLLQLSCSTGRAEEPDRKPNIVFIFTDDLGYGDLGCFGATDIKTPNIDALADQGLKFTSFYSASSICSPSRAGLLTGRMPQRMGINTVFFPESFTGMPSSEMTIAEMLKDQGYHTGIVGKWHLGHLEKYLPLQQGFDEYFGIPYSNDMRSVVYMRGNEVEEFFVDQHYTTKTYTEEAVKYIEKNKDQPFFLYLAHNMPHVPIYASEDFEGTSERGLYGDVVQEIDWSVGQIMDKLEALGLLDNTLVVFSSDNGPWLVMKDHGGSPGPLREGKQYTFEGGMRVPTIAMWRGEIKAGSTYDDIASQLDWMPTFASITGGKVPDDRPIDGEDISRVLFGTGNRLGDSYLFFDGETLRCYREGKWKVKLPYKGFKGAIWKKGVAAHDTLLFDLEADPGEQINLYSQYPDLVRELFQKMEAEKEGLGELPPSLIVHTDADESHYYHLGYKKK